ncbi:MAG: hypothetical protein ACO1ON_11880 [Nocardioides sp.]
MTTPSRTLSARPSRVARTALATLALLTAAASTGVAVEAARADVARADAPQERPTRLDPERLERGPDASVPYRAGLDGRDIVEDGVVTRVRADWFQLLGTRPDGRYVVLAVRGEDHSVRTIAPGGRSSRVLLDDVRGATALLGTDGTTVVTERFRSRPRRHTVLRAYDATTGELLGQRKRQGYTTVLDASSTTVVHAGENGPVVSWDLATGDGARVSTRYGYRADLLGDRLAVFTKDPYQGGCTVVSTLSDPRAELWRSCEEAVVEFSPDGSHLLTVFKLADGLGPREARVRTVEGTEVGRYRVDGFLGQLLFEDADTALLEVATEDSSGLVRCDGPDCELASELGKGSPYL